jgi:hypothetical protein
MGDDMSSLELAAPYEQLRAASHRWSYSYVMISGVFRLGDARATSGARLGILDGARVLAPMPHQTEDRTNLDPAIRIELEENESS